MQAMPKLSHLTLDHHSAQSMHARMPLVTSRSAVRFTKTNLTCVFWLTGLAHPPLFACVLQKVNSGQRLECHLFVCLNPDDAISMCNQMAELQQRASNIGKLKVPLPGQMGSYSYKSTPVQSSAASIVSHRSSSYAFSEQPSLTAKHHFSANSDIEEEDAGRLYTDQLNSLNSNATSDKGIVILGKQLAPQFANGKYVNDQRYVQHFNLTKKNIVIKKTHLNTHAVFCINVESAIK